LTLLQGFYAAVKDDLGLVSLVVMPLGFALIILVAGFYFYQKNKNTINDYLSY
jgi:ABC-type polysaccharide/polyol phosphate export permease